MSLLAAYQGASPSPSMDEERLKSIGDTRTSGASLPPKTLKKLSRRRLIIRHATAFCAWAAIIGICAPFTSYYAKNDLTSFDACEAKTGTNAEKLFGINLRLGGDLNYEQAKAIDVLWDLVIGQSGRLLQGYLLYQVAIDALTYMMERSAVPYHLYANVSLSWPTSWDGFRSIVKMAFRRNKWQSALISIWLLLSTLHVLGFPLLWETATGYINPSKEYYQLHNGELISQQSNELNYCIYITDPFRVNLDESIVVGPTVIGSGPLTNGTYANLLNYMKNAQALLTAAFPADTFSNLTAVNSSLISHFPSTYTTPYTPQPFNDTWSPPNASHPFVFNSTFTPQSPGEIPYNSSLTLPNGTVPLNAPMLRFGPQNSSSLLAYFANAPNLCYAGALISGDPDELFGNDNLHCISDPGFVWGFSTFLLSLATIVQMVWSTALYGVWVFVGWKGELRGYGRSGAGRLRAAVDVAAAVERELGGELGAYGDGEIRRALGGVGEVGWAVEEEDGEGYGKDGSVARLRLRSWRRGERRWRGEKIVVEEGRLYA